MKKTLFTISLLVFIFIKTELKAQDGTLDNTFGTNGSMVLTGGLSGGSFNSVLVQPDGKIIAGGHADSLSTSMYYINRLNANGTADASFNGGAPKKFQHIINNNYNIIQGLTLMDDGSILYAGTTASNSGVNQNVSLGKLSSTGVRSSGYTATYSAYSGGNNVATGISYNKIEDKIAVAGYVQQTGPYSSVFKMLPDGTPDVILSPVPNAGYKFYSTTYSYTTSIIELPNGSLLVACNTGFSATGFTVLKIKKDGTFDTNFGSTNTGIATIPIGTTAGAFPKAMVLLPNGKILLAGTVNNSTDIGVMRLNANGTADNTFNTIVYDYASASTDGATSLLIQPDKKIVVGGNSTKSSVTSALVMRFSEDGIVDNTFGTNGSLAVAGAQILSSDISIKEGKAVFAGSQISSSKFFLMKVNLFAPQKFNIIGKDIVSIETQNKYSVDPVVDGYTYLWTYSSNNIYTLGSNAEDSVTLYFTKATPSGTLSCNVFNTIGSLTQQLTKQIQVNQEPTLAELLTEPKCSVVQTVCETSYINSFSITQTELKSVNTGCSATGYSDLTASGNYDTLYIGDNYQAKIQSVDSSGAVVYAGVWIDFNNDGQILDDKEFVGSTFSQTGELTVNNIYIPASSEPGPKRIRVRARESGPFTAAEFCAVDNEISETEDYLVVFYTYQEILAPNFITPNDDGKNDNFIVRGIKDNVKNSLKVFTRTGDLVYDTENYDNSWGGKDKNDGKLKPGTYYYVFTQDNPDKKKEDVVKGFFEIRY